MMVGVSCTINILYHVYTMYHPIIGSGMCIIPPIDAAYICAKSPQRSHRGRHARYFCIFALTQQIDAEPCLCNARVL